MLYKKKKEFATKWYARATNWESGKNESRALILYKKLCKVDPLQFWMMYYSYFYEQKSCWKKVVSIEKNAIDCTGASMSLSTQTRIQHTFI